jgi:hypothetical protein
MATGTSLSILTDQLRAEIGASPSSSGQGLNSIPMLQQVLRRTQNRLFYDFDWPNLVIDRDTVMQKGENYYTFPSDLDYDSITGAWVYYSSSWRPVVCGFDPLIYNSSNPALGVQNDPLVAWRHYEGNQYEVWPVPASNATTLRFRGRVQVPRLTALTDCALLDDDLIVLFAAAEILTRLKAPDGQAKLSLAEKHYRNLKMRLTKTKDIVLGGTEKLPREWPMLTRPISVQ